MQPNLPAKYRTEIIRFDATLVDFVSRHASSPTIPVPAKFVNDWPLINEIKAVLDDTSWEAMGADGGWVYFKRYKLGAYGTS